MWPWCFPRPISFVRPAAVHCTSYAFATLLLYTTQLESALWRMSDPVTQVSVSFFFSGSGGMEKSEVVISTTLLHVVWRSPSTQRPRNLLRIVVLLYLSRDNGYTRHQSSYAVLLLGNGSCLGGVWGRWDYISLSLSNTHRCDSWLPLHRYEWVLDTKSPRVSSQIMNGSYMSWWGCDQHVLRRDPVRDPFGQSHLRQLLGRWRARACEHRVNSIHSSDFLFPLVSRLYISFNQVPTYENLICCTWAMSDRATTVRKKFPQFRILVIGRANAGKTTLLQRVCKTTESPIVRNRDGAKVTVEFLCYQPTVVC